MKFHVLTISLAAAFSNSCIAGGLDGGVATDPYALSAGPSSEATYSGNVAVGPAAKTTLGESATAVGATSVAGPSSVAIGAGANAYADKGVSIGASSSSNGGSPDGGNVSIGYDARMAPVAGGSVTGSVVLGAGSRATESNVVSVGRAETDSGVGIPQPAINRRIVNMADGVAESDGATVRQVSVARSAATAAQTTAANAMAAASTAQTGITSLNTRVSHLEASAGVDATARTDVANITNGNADLAKAKVGTTTVGAVAVTADRAETKADAADAKAGAAQATASRAETKADVAQNTASTAQATANRAEAKGDVAQNTAAAAQSSASAAQMKANQSWDLGTSLQTRFDDFASKTGQRLDSIENRMDSMTREYRAGIATAIAGVHSVTAAGRSGVGVGLGTFQGQTAIGIGLAAEISQTRVSASLQFSNGATAFGAGLAVPLKF